MYCSKCGAEMQPDQMFCPACGQQVNQTENGQQSQQPIQSQIPPQQNFYQQQPMNDQYYGQQIPMKWYKFISYVQLPLSVLVLIATALMYIAGSHYEDSKDLVYLLFPALKTIDILMGIACLLLAAVSGVVCMKMIKMKRDAVKFYLLSLAISAIISMLYVLFTSICIKEITLTSNLTSTFIVQIVMIFINKSYFEKRKQYFIN